MPKMTIEVDEATLEEIRDAVVVMSRSTYGYTLRGFAETALRNELQRLREEHNNGNPFPPRGDLTLRKGPVVGRR